MFCPKCNNPETKVIDSRLSEKNKAIRRRRECEKCANRFTTFERREFTNLVVVKKDGTREPYNQEKLERGILIACSKRHITHKQITSLINELEDSWTSKEISTEIIGQAVMFRLKKIDNIAYIRFASVYKDFRDIDEFKDILKNLGR